ncbi:hypothetical protein [Bacillus sp. CGMCC 1.16541]|uniref:hypothetical protein n=1 Tax=Bacillus sp. CGMCC 1.16541 TaxID=2185143 RepID=UPI000D72E9D4|nr:hypothetical protein [Bacillus sp. CGMCC 1.16541]
MYNNEKEETPLQKYNDEQRRQDLQLLSINETETNDEKEEETTSVDIVFVEGKGWKLDSDY